MPKVTQPAHHSWSSDSLPHVPHFHRAAGQELGGTKTVRTDHSDLARFHPPIPYEAGFLDKTEGKRTPIYIYGTPFFGQTLE